MMDRREFLCGALVATGSLALWGCRKAPAVAPLPELPDRSGPLLSASELPPAPRPVLRVPGGDLGVPTPFAYYLPPGYFQMIYFYDSLLWTDSTGKLVPWLATALPERSPDGLTYRFEVRDNVRFHDGRPLTASDIVFTFEYFAAQKPNLSPLLLFTPDHVASVRTTGPRTVEFRLDKPAVTFLQQVAGRVPIIPRHIWSQVGEPGAQDPALVVGSGPYRLEEYAAAQGRYLLTANDDFFLGRPFVRRIESHQVGDPISALLAGEVDAAGLDQPTPSAIRRLQRDDALGVVKGPPDFIYALHWNIAKRGAMADPRFRRACAMAIDRTDIVRRLTGGLGEEGNPGFLPRNHEYRVEVEQYRHDPDAAGRLLDEAGYRREANGARVGPDGKPLRFRLQTLPAARVTGLVARALERLGISIEIDPVDIVGSGDFDMVVLVNGGHQGDPDLMRIIYSSRVPPQFFRSAIGYVNPEFDDLADRQLVTLDIDERKRLVARMQEIVAADLPLLHLYYPTPVVVFRESVLDQVAIHPNGFGPLNKQALVTGVATGGTEIRPSV